MDDIEFKINRIQCDINEIRKEYLKQKDTTLQCEIAMVDNIVFNGDIEFKSDDMPVCIHTFDLIGKTSYKDLKYCNRIRLDFAGGFKPFDVNTVLRFLMDKGYEIVDVSGWLNGNIIMEKSPKVG